MGALKEAVIHGDVAKGSLMDGKSVGMVDKVQTLDEIIKELLQDGEAELRRLQTELAP